MIVAPALREKTVLVPDVAVFAALIAPFKSATLKVLSLTVAVASDSNESVENSDVTFPAVSNVFSSDAVPVISDTELAVITPVVLLFKVIRALASDTVVSVIVTDSVPILLIPFSVLAIADVSVPVGSVVITVSSVPVGSAVIAAVSVPVSSVPVALGSVPVSVG